MNLNSDSDSGKIQSLSKIQKKTKKISSKSKDKITKINVKSDLEKSNSENENENEKIKRKKKINTSSRSTESKVRRRLFKSSVSEQSDSDSNTVKTSVSEQSDSETNTSKSSLSELKKKIQRKKTKVESDNDSVNDSVDESVNETVIENKVSKKSILKDEEKKIKKTSSFFLIEKILKNKSKEKILIITEKQEVKVIKEFYTINLSKQSKDYNLDCLSFKESIDFIYKVISKNNFFTDKEKEEYNNIFSSYDKIFLLTKNDLIIFLHLHLFNQKTNLICLYKTFSELEENVDKYFLKENHESNYDVKEINTNIKSIISEYTTFLKVHKELKTNNDIINKNITIEINNINNYNNINYFSGLNYLEEEILFYILNKNDEYISFVDTYSYLHSKINSFYEKLLFINFKSLVKKLYQNFTTFKNTVSIKTTTKIKFNIKLLKEIFFVHKYIEEKKKIILLSIIPICFIDYMNYLKYDLKDLINYFKSDFQIKKIKKTYSKFSNIELETSNKNIILKYDINDDDKINFSNINFFDKSALIKKCLKYDNKLSVEKDIFTFLKSLDNTKLNVQKKLLKTNIQFKKTFLTHYDLEQKFEENCKFYKDYIFNYFKFIFLVNLYVSSNSKDEDKIEEEITLYNNIISTFPFNKIKHKKILEKYNIELTNENINEENIFDEEIIKNEFIKFYNIEL